ncbi:anti-sigma factor [Zunongwangia sp. F363]|uniref:Regulator of SigK n=1 Tax=Autumnicola tepida TaxID=3075595 RepID=A0ABU3CA75_9FLAO|nr:anti-sigma factor [Zunongwangia sp. F363]MDT0643234.1 anti-sigma factor [Zunongwangia sp. F363]
MDLQEYISSGILELYVCGALSEEESREVSHELKQHPEIREEVEEIEKALSQLAIGVAPYNPEHLLASLKSKIEDRNGETTIPVRRKTSTVFAYLGWAASFLLLIGLFFLFNRNNDLRESLRTQQARNAQMEQQIADARANAESARELLAMIRDRNTRRIPLAGQAVAPDSYATVYWNTEENQAFIDAQGLPEPPRGKVYQVWSLTMQPLKPTSIGLLSNFTADENKVFQMRNTNNSEAFGITLEPEGGSETPTMDQLYVMGTVSTP